VCFREDKGSALAVTVTVATGACAGYGGKTQMHILVAVEDHAVDWNAGS
jgi:hypothetical protein